MRAHLVFAVIVGACLPAPSARASEAAEALISQGVALRREGRNAEALALFQRAFADGHQPRARAQIALAEQALGLWVEAERDLIAALAELEDPWIARNREPLEGAREVIGKHLASLDVTCNEVGATLAVNGTLTSTLPLARPLRVVAGELRLEVAKVGFDSLRRTISVAPGVTAREALPLVPSRPEATRTATSAVAAAPAQVIRVVEVPASNSTSAWVALGGGLTLVAAGVVAHIVYETNASTWNDDSRCLVGGASREATCGDYRQRADVARIVAIAGYGLGGAAAIAGALLILVSRPAASDAGAASPGGALACAPDPALGIGARCLISF